MKRPRLNEVAQQIIEYLVLTAAVVAAIAVFARPGGYFRGAVNRVLHESTGAIQWGTNTLCVGNHCGPYCGNGYCEYSFSESCSSCPQDCGACAVCPNGKCEFGETCATCPPDCGICPGGTCGDGVKDTFDECDGSDFGGLTCADYAGLSGSLTCNPNCTINTSSCVRLCGNGTIDGLEECDPPLWAIPDTNGDSIIDCKDLGFASGTLTCVAPGEALECTIDKSQCNACGNGAVDPGEICDPGSPPTIPSALGGKSCTDYRVGSTLTNGLLRCAADCLSYDDSLCCSAWVPGQCLADCGTAGTCAMGYRCETRTCPSGAPGALAQCTADSPACVIDCDAKDVKSDWCDAATRLDGIPEGTPAYPVTYYAFGMCMVPPGPCAAECQSAHMKVDTTGCTCYTADPTYGTWTWDGDSCECTGSGYSIYAICGDNVITSPETCDPPGATGAACLAPCTYNIRTCTAGCVWSTCPQCCGDGVLTAPEACDPPGSTTLCLWPPFSHKDCLAGTCQWGSCHY